VREDGQGATYAEVRRWAVWLKMFTADDLAQAMGVSVAVGERGIKALLWHGICRDTGDTLPGSTGPQPLIEYVPLPERIYNREKVPPPERVVGYTELFGRRGFQVSLRQRGRESRTGTWRPGRTNGQKKAPAVEVVKSRGKRRGVV
jgi:hypothetical protein